MHQIRKHRRNVLQPQYDYEKSVYEALRSLYALTIAERNYLHEHLFGALLCGLKQGKQDGMFARLASAVLGQVMEEDRQGMFAETLRQIQHEIAAGAGLVEEDLRM